MMRLLALVFLLFAGCLTPFVPVTSKQGIVTCPEAWPCAEAAGIWRGAGVDLVLGPGGLQVAPMSAEKRAETPAETVGLFTLGEDGAPIVWVDQAWLESASEHRGALLIAHELGHALGLPHLPDWTGLMSHVPIELSQADLDLLAASDPWLRNMWMR